MSFKRANIVLHVHIARQIDAIHFLIFHQDFSTIFLVQLQPFCQKSPYCSFVLPLITIGAELVMPSENLWPRRNGQEEKKMWARCLLIAGLGWARCLTVAGLGVGKMPFFSRCARLGAVFALSSARCWERWLLLNPWFLVIHSMDGDESWLVLKPLDILLNEKSKRKIKNNNLHVFILGYGMFDNFPWYYFATVVCDLVLLLWPSSINIINYWSKKPPSEWSQWQ